MIVRRVVGGPVLGERNIPWELCRHQPPRQPRPRLSRLTEFGNKVSRLGGLAGTWSGDSAEELDAPTVSERSEEVPVYRYDPVRQVELNADGELWVSSEQGKTWSSTLELDGDEGRSEQWGWDDDGKDVTEGF
jgi:hypothetical protein